MEKVVKNRSISPPIWIDKVVLVLEAVQDFIIISLCLGLFGVMVLQLRSMFLSLLPPLDFQAVTADILFIPYNYLNRLKNILPKNYSKSFLNNTFIKLQVLNPCRF